MRLIFKSILSRLNALNTLFGNNIPVMDFLWMLTSTRNGKEGEAG